MPDPSPWPRELDAVLGPIAAAPPLPAAPAESSAPFRLPALITGALFGHLLSRTVAVREPDLTIGGEQSPYLRRWFLLPRGDEPSCYFHQFLRDDDDRALHDHPWDSISIVLHAGYVERTPDGEVLRQPGDVVPRDALSRHRVILLRDEAGRPRPCFTLFLTGRRVRDWGFWCPGATAGLPERFVPWRAFTSGPNGERVGAGCDAAAAEG